MENRSTSDIPGRPPLSRAERRRQSRIWYAFVIVPVLGLAHMIINYATIDWSSETHNWWLPRVVPIPFIVLAALGVWWTFRERRAPLTVEETDSIAERTRFMANVGLVVSSLTVILLLCQWVATFIIEPTK